MNYDITKESQGETISPIEVKFQVKAYAACKRHRRRNARHPEQHCRCRTKLLGVREGKSNLATNVFAGFVRCGLFGTNTTVTDTGSTGRAITKAIDGGAASLSVGAGTSGTAATVADVNMTFADSQGSPTVNAISGSGSSGTFTVTGTITAGADRAYQEVGIKMTTTTNSWVFLLCRDTFSTLNVSNTGTLAVTYTITNS